MPVENNKEKFNDRELTLVRTYNAPRELVYKAWIERDQLAQWWAPKNFTNPVCEIDVRPGGKINITMRGPDGTDYPMGGEFQEVIENEKLVFTSTAYEDENGDPLLKNLNTVTFKAKDGKTELTLHVDVLITSDKVKDAHSGMKQGWNESLDKLEEFLK